MLRENPWPLISISSEFFPLTSIYECQIPVLNSPRRRKWQPYLILPLESLAGQDLLQGHNEDHDKAAAKRKIRQAKLKSSSTPIIDSVNADESVTNEPDPTTESAIEDEPEAEEADPEERKEDNNSAEVVDGAEPTKQLDGAGEDDLLGDKPEPEPEAPASESDEDTDNSPAEDTPQGPEHLAYCDNCGVRFYHPSTN